MEVQLASGIVGNPITFIGPDGKQYVAIYSGIGGWMGAVAFPDVSADDPYAALGVVGAMKDIKKYHAARRHSLCLQFLRLVARRCRGCAHASAVRCTAPQELRVCADPNNLPFSNQQQQGFENKIAAI